MNRTFLLMACLLVSAHLQGKADEGAYATLCTNVVAALGDGKRLTSPAFTNQMHVYLSEPSVEMRSMAELALSISRFSMFEQSQRNADYEASCQFCSNVLSAADLPVRSWQKSLASVLYAGNLAIDGKYKCARTVCEAGLSVHLASPTTDAERAVWAAIAAHDLVPEISITNALNLCAALSLLGGGETSGLSAYTNGLPPQAMRLLHERPMVGKEGDW